MGKVFKAMQRKQYLEVDVRAVDSSVQIMNHFDGFLGTHISYGTLILNNALLMRIFGHRYSISLFIAKSKPEDYPVPEQATTASTTFSELRLLTKELREFSTTDPMQVSSRSV